MSPLEDFAEIGSDWFWETDAALSFSYFSESTKRFLGREVAELIGLSRKAIAENADDKAFWQPYADDLQAHRPFRDFAYPYGHPDGVTRWLSVSGRPIFSQDGCFIGYRGVGRDVTAEHKTQEALSEQIRRCDAALENMTQGLCMFDATSQLVMVNRRYYDIFGLAASDIIIGLTHREIVKKLFQAGCYRGEITIDQLCEKTTLALQDEHPVPSYRELADGRIIAASFRSMTGGGWVATFEDFTERRRNEARIAHMALHDTLTGLPNRALLHDRLSQAIARTTRTHSPFAVLMCDLDRFKAVNDSLGHPVGDALLRVVAERMQAVLRPYDTVARIGGDEFAIVLDYLDEPGAAACLAERLIEAVGKPVCLDEQTIEVGVSIGLAVADENDYSTDDLFKRADIALYEAKAAGRNTYREFCPNVGNRIATRSQLGLDMKEAIRRGEFHLVYQPIVEATTGAVVSFEALMRWQHPLQGTISPSEFIPLAEETGLIVPLGAWALQEACREALTWPKPIRIGVNVSAVQFRRGLEEAVLSALATTGLPAHRLKLEVTESVLMQDADGVLACLHRLRALGVVIALDDFGTGYSSLSYLRRFPFDKIKIDRSFIRDIADPDAAAIVRAVVGIGERLGMGIVAEGVETVDQLKLVRQEGCTQVQGFLFSRPLLPGDARAYITSTQAAAA
ncbi:EAL domain-containing protein [Methylobacterium sp. E-041]|uniref:putative bifunctional diguanylate cyclase/phosphodiesterase n=1 Tax=Methylobacterium sp. E-041 TaxID=2836573 RepID=UPI001FBB1444|nr:EAL domain-containing protein [Methylobacterium sp. E-041]MCJ2103846.1 EAL domain-containing protein [Methylobacterium sp. E-041]